MGLAVGDDEPVAPLADLRRPVGELLKQPRQARGDRREQLARGFGERASRPGPIRLRQVPRQPVPVRQVRREDGRDGGRGGPVQVGERFQDPGTPVRRERVTEITPIAVHEREDAHRVPLSDPAHRLPVRRPQGRHDEVPRGLRRPLLRFGSARTGRGGPPVTQDPRGLHGAAQPAERRRRPVAAVALVRQVRHGDEPPARAPGFGGDPVVVAEPHRRVGQRGGRQPPRGQRRPDLRLADALRKILHAARLARTPADGTPFSPRAAATTGAATPAAPPPDGPRTGGCGRRPGRPKGRAPRRDAPREQTRRGAGDRISRRRRRRRTRRPAG